MCVCLFVCGGVCVCVCVTRIFLFCLTMRAECHSRFDSAQEIAGKATLRDDRVGPGSPQASASPGPLGIRGALSGGPAPHAECRNPDAEPCHGSKHFGQGLRIASLEVYMPLGQKDLAAKIAAEPLAPTWVWEKVPGVSHGKGIRMCNSAGGN